MSEPVTDERIHDRLTDAVRGDVLRPGDTGYDDARTVWNGLFDKYPAVIVQCTGAADVMAAVNVARENDLLLSVKSGGHGYAGKAVCDDGMVIDLSAMDSVRVDPEARTARVGPGATWDDVYHETQTFGLATPGGAGIVGVAGFTLGGGISYLSRKHGLTCDNLLAADVVTADGRLVHANADGHSDLFWGLRGGSGNFGIVTSFEYQLHEVGPEVLAGTILHPYESAREVLELYREVMADAPDELGCFALFLRVPPEPPFPEEYHGEPAIGLGVCYAGAVEDGEAAVAPVREFGDPILDGVRPQPYLEFKQSNDELYEAIDRWYSKSHYLAGLPDDAIDVILEYTEDLPGPFTMVGLLATGGAITRVDRTATAFPHRDAAFEFDIWPGWTDPEDDEALIGWATEFHEAMAPYATGGVYVNMLSHDEDDRVRAAYGDNYERLAELKTEWDPENLFRMNQNIEPTG